MLRLTLRLPEKRIVGMDVILTRFQNGFTLEASMFDLKINMVPSVKIVQ